MNALPISPDEPLSPDSGAIDTAANSDIPAEALALAVLEQSDDCIKMLGADGSLQFMNCGGLRAMEIDEFRNVSGKLWWELWPEDSQSMVKSMFEMTCGGRETDFVAFCPTAKGQPRRWAVKLKPMISRDGRVAGVLCTSRDITQLTAANS
jgi:PAS domain S-box-containing protein